MQRDYICIPVEWAVGALAAVGFAGVLLGLFSFFKPEKSIRLYQVMMRYFHWMVDPLFPEREVRNTRWLGLVMALLNLAILFLVLRFQ